MQRVDVLLGGRRRLAQDAVPGEGVDFLEYGQHARRDGAPGDSVGAVAAGDEVAGELGDLVAVTVSYFRLLGGEVVDAEVLHPEQQRPRGIDPSLHQVLDDLVLRVDRDLLAAGKRREVDALITAVEAQDDALCGKNPRAAAARRRRFAS